jgi:cardiolipin synthase
MSFADKLSILRIILIPVFISLLIYSRSNQHIWYLPVVVFIIAVLTDFFDGLVARIKKEKSDIGKVLDPLADKLLLLTAFVSLRMLGFPLPLWVVSIVVSRDLIILLGIVILHFLKIDIPIAPSKWGKLTTFFQILTVILILLHSVFPKVILIVAWSLAVIFTLISGVERNS